MPYRPGCRLFLTSGFVCLAIFLIETAFFLYFLLAQSHNTPPLPPPTPPPPKKQCLCNFFFLGGGGEVIEVYYGILQVENRFISTRFRLRLLTSCVQNPFRNILMKGPFTT